MSLESYEKARSAGEYNTVSFHWLLCSELSDQVSEVLKSIKPNQNASSLKSAFCITAVPQAVLKGLCQSTPMTASVGHEVKNHQLLAPTGECLLSKRLHCECHIIVQLSGTGGLNVDIVSSANGLMA
jgi:hypothetical protein